MASSRRALAFGGHRRKALVPLATLRKVINVADKTMRLFAIQGSGMSLGPDATWNSVIALHDTPRSRHCEHDPRAECVEGYEGRDPGLGSLSSARLRARWKTMSDDEKLAAGNVWAINGQMRHALSLMRDGIDPERMPVPRERTPAAFRVVVKNALARLDAYAARLPEDVTEAIKREIPEHVAELRRSHFPASGDMRDLDSYMLMVVDALVYQEQQSWRRQLGDHGVRHVLDDVSSARAMANQVHQFTGTVGHDDLAVQTCTAIFHDIGYTADAARKTFEGTKLHPQYGAMWVHHNATLFDRVFGTEARERIEDMIVRHQDADIDWYEDPVGSSIRVADNLALFAREKLPALFKYVSGAIATLEEMGHIRDSDPTRFKVLKRQLKEQVRASKLKPNLKRDLMRAADEVGPATPRFTLGMMAGERMDPSFDGETMHVPIRYSDEMRRISELFGEQQARAQFAKLAESYGAGPEQFENGEIWCHGKGGNLHVRVVGAPSGALTSKADKRPPVLKHLPGRHDQKDHGTPANKFDVRGFLRRTLQGGFFEDRIWSLPEENFLQIIDRVKQTRGGIRSFLPTKPKNALDALTLEFSIQDLESTIRDRERAQRTAPISYRSKVFEATLAVQSGDAVENKINVMKSVSQGMKNRLEAKFGGPAPYLVNMPSEERSKLAERVAKRYLEKYPFLKWNPESARFVFARLKWNPTGRLDIFLSVKDNKGRERIEELDEDMLGYIDPRLAASYKLGSYDHSYGDPYDNIAAGLVDAWATSSSDNNIRSVMIQRAVAQRFHLHDSTRDFADSTTNEDADELLEKYGDFVNAFVDSVYENTQNLLKDFDKVTLYRGVHWGDDPQNMPKELMTSDYASVVNVGLNPLSSFSTSAWTALSFAGTRVTSRVLAVTVPRDRIFSTFLTGPGCTNELEVLVLGDTAEALVLEPGRLGEELHDHGEVAIDRAARRVKDSPLHLSVVFIDDEYNQDWPKRTDDRLETLRGNPDTVNKHLPGRHDQKDHGSPAKDKLDVGDFLRRVAYGSISIARNIWALRDDDFLKVDAELKRLKRSGKGLRSLLPMMADDALEDLESAIRERAYAQKKAPISCRTRVFQATLEKRSGDDKANKISTMKSVGQAMRQRLDAKFGELPDLMNMSPEELSDLAKRVARRYLDEHKVTGAPINEFIATPWDPTLKLDPETARFALEDRAIVSRPLVALVIDDEDGQEHRLPVDAEILRYIDERLAAAYDLAYFLWSDDDDVYENIAAGLVDTWASSSSDSNTKSIALQRAVARRFHVHDNTKDFVQTSVSQEADELLEKYGDFFDAFVDSVYENTQNFLKDVDKITLYRGVHWGDDPKDMPDELRQPGFDYAWGAAVELNPLSSFSSDLWTAAVFAGERHTSRVLAVTVPRDRIFSTFLTGPGCTGESEIVVLGDTAEALVLEPKRFRREFEHYQDAAVDRASQLVSNSPLRLSVAFIDDEYNQDWPKRTDDRLETLLGNPDTVNKHLPGRHDQKDHGSPAKRDLDVWELVRKIAEGDFSPYTIWSLPDKDFVKLDAEIKRLKTRARNLPANYQLAIGSLEFKVGERARAQEIYPIASQSRVFDATLFERSKRSTAENKMDVVSSVAQRIKDRLDAKFGDLVPDPIHMSSKELTNLAQKVAKRYIKNHPNTRIDGYDRSTNTDQLNPESAEFITHTEAGRPEITLIIKDKNGLAYNLHGDSTILGYIDQRLAAAYEMGRYDQWSEKPYENIVAGLIDSWADSSSDSNAQSIALQRAVARRFNLHDSTGDFADDGVSHAADELLDKYGDFFDAFVDTVYEQTQESLKDFDKVTLYRGVNWIDAPNQMPKGLKRRDDAWVGTVDLNPLSSFASYLPVATVFADEHPTSRVIAITVPRERIFSTPLTGPGCLDEHEIIVLGDTAEALVLKAARFGKELTYIDPVAQRVKDSPLRLSAVFIDDEYNRDWPKRTNDRLQSVLMDRDRGSVSKHLPGQHDQKKHGRPASRPTSWLTVRIDQNLVGRVSRDEFKDLMYAEIKERGLDFDPDLEADRLDEYERVFEKRAERLRKKSGIPVEPTPKYRDEIRRWAAEKLKTAGLQAPATLYILGAPRRATPLTDAMAEYIEKRSSRDAMVRAMESQVKWNLGGNQLEWVAAQALGGNGSEAEMMSRVPGEKAELTEDIKQAFRARTEFIQARVREKYGDEITVYRGVYGTYAGKLKQLWRAGGSPEQEIDIPVRSLQSWTTDMSAAAQFAFGYTKSGLLGKRGGVVLKKRISWKDVWGSNEIGAKNAIRFSDDHDELVVLHKEPTTKAEIIWQQ
jgi:hypothetical protein